jgi:hypothetical protein
MPPSDTSLPSDAAALDAYSTVVSTVAAKLLPSVAALAVRTNRGEGRDRASRSPMTGSSSPALMWSLAPKPVWQSSPMVRRAAST